ncbi:MAG: hypothetical protein FWB93_03035 [Oscillospiraceae bacterium]|nr:hypothetical protein [Oscillospiraceae bacterium]
MILFDGIYSLLALIIFLAVSLGPPAVTLYNLYRIFSKPLLKSFILTDGEEPQKQPKSKKLKFPLLIDTYTIVGGLLMSGYAVAYITNGDWHTAICAVCDYHHNALYSGHLIAFLIPVVFAVAALFLLRIDREYPPIVTLLIYAFVYIGMVLSVVWIIQLWGGFNNAQNISWFAILFLILYPFNYILLSFIYLKKSIQRLNNGRNCKLGKFIFKSCNTWAWAFIVLIPLCGILIVFLTLFGQSPNSIVRVFTETAGWTFSQRVPPPPLNHTGHYLCTVAAKGKKSIAKPLFVGKRHNRPIIVNRQLQVANAFEDLIAEKLPRIHKKLRGLYDKYGYPVSRHINTTTRSTMTYIAMKPVEWLFLFILYSVDIKPEERITRQYVPVSDLLKNPSFTKI